MPTVQHAPARRKPKYTKRQHEPVASQQTTPVHASPDWGISQPQAAALPSSIEEETSQDHVGGSALDTAALQLAVERIQGLEAELAAANSELAAAKAQLADKETQLTAMSMLVRERVSGRAAAP